MKREAKRGGRWGARSSRGACGSVMLEFVIAFPLILVLALACFQMAQVWIAKMVVHYAAFCAARTALVRPAVEYDAFGQQAARQVCDSFQGGWLQAQTSLTDEPLRNVTAQVTGTFSLITPIVGPMIAWGMNPWDETSAWSTPVKSGSNMDRYRFPTITLSETVTLPKPYLTLVASGN